MTDGTCTCLYQRLWTRWDLCLAMRFVIVGHTAMSLPFVPLRAKTFLLAFISPRIARATVLKVNADVQPNHPRAAAAESAAC